MNPKLNVPQAAFLALPHKFRAYVAGYGCVRGDTLIVTEKGLIPIQEIKTPMRVLSWNERKHQFELALTGGAFPKGADYLYRVCTQQGEFVASGHHRIFSSDSSYQRVDSLCVGDKVQSFCTSLRQTSLEFAPLSSHEGGQHSIQKLLNSMVRYANEARQYGQSLLQEVDSDLTFSQEQGDAHKSDHKVESMGGHQVLLQSHSRQGQQSDQQCRTGLIRPSVLHEEVLPCCLLSRHFEHALQCTLVFLQFVLKPIIPLTQSRLFVWLRYFLYAWVLFFALILCRISRYTDKLMYAHNPASYKAAKQLFVGQHSHKSRLLKGSKYYSIIKTSNIISITRLKEKQVFYDMQVVDNNNYVTVDGTIHHNSGKTWAGCSSSCQHSWTNPKVNAGYFAPTYPQIRDIFYPTIEECAFDWGLNCKINLSNKEVHVYNGKTYRNTIICRSMDNPASIVGFKIGKALVDEIDTLNKDKATHSWRKIIARMRAKAVQEEYHEEVELLENQIQIVSKLNGIDLTTTPEGFKFTHQQFVSEPSQRPEIRGLYGLIQASTYDNELNLPDDYISSLKLSYPPQLIEAYLNGQFVNLNSGSVYADFDRKLNHTDITVSADDVLHIGMDFNVLKMASVVHVIRDGLPFAVDEFVNLRDTPAMCQAIKERYPEHTICVYPDASGKNTSSKSSSVSDHSIIESHGFKIYTQSTNPAIKDRLNAMNAMILNSNGERRYQVNTDKCPNYTECLEQQIFGDDGMPDKKSGHDHLNDAGGYFIAYKYPVTKPATKLDVRFN